MAFCTLKLESVVGNECSGHAAKYSEIIPRYNFACVLASAYVMTWVPRNRYLLIDHAIYKYTYGYEKPKILRVICYFPVVMY